ncbi:hypothetical protein [Clostridium weizhouense]|uniref:Uncharacterized protein n=1 Tax=Clostridium weizhouense TaxID=2859781 RepID=A0ABS7AJ74_9CLOT|nr:hypothetical protein [Clostridium weizhouense]MBW6408710.1 hypothetical protein [Clostridium weizhouense]
MIISNLTSSIDIIVIVLIIAGLSLIGMIILYFIVELQESLYENKKKNILSKEINNNLETKKEIQCKLNK